MASQACDGRLTIATVQLASVMSGLLAWPDRVLHLLRDAVLWLPKQVLPEARPQQRPRHLDPPPVALASGGRRAYGHMQ
jgi:hypothetical protein